MRIGAGIADMSAQECRERIARGGVGRVAWCTSDGPQVQPVNFAVVEDEIVFRTSPYGVLGTQVDGRSVAVEVDEIDPEARSGWSVVVRGEASVVGDPDEMVHLRRHGPQPWAPGLRLLVVRVRPRTMTGRHVNGDG